DSTDTFTDLTPRQEITPTPYTMYAQKSDWNNLINLPSGFLDGIDNVGSGDSDWTISGSNMYSAVPGKVGIGTTSPNTKLEVDGYITARGIYGNNLSIDSARDIEFKIDYNNDGTFFGYFELYNGAGTNIWNVDEVGNMIVAGNVTIGTLISSDKLNVEGAINSSSTYKLDGETVLSNFGTENIFVGEDVGARNTTGSSNSAMGFKALYYNTEGAYNSAQGANALFRNTTGRSNSALGAFTLNNNSSGYYNSALGYTALTNNTT
ncbi:MAG: hypothetical protein GY869_01195, partial [Planctomycetes bacterium]|nr:hypothetical protein [Planctomycetota bacterium]